MSGADKMLNEAGKRNATLSFLTGITYQSYSLLWWYLRGRPSPPPPIIKRRIVKDFRRRFGLKVFVETGTYLGDMVDAVKSQFKEIYSIELSEALYQRALSRFSNDPHVHLLMGDSGSVLPLVLDSISEPCLFWLDGHYSGGFTAQGELDYPVLKELSHIRNHPIKSHVILIDDARTFIGEGAVPSRDEVVRALKDINPDYNVKVENDIIRAFIQQP